MIKTYIETRYFDPYAVPFYVEDLSGANNTLSIVKSNNTAPTVTIQYSTDKQNWQNLGSTSRTALTYTIPANGRVYLRANVTNWGSVSKYNKITASGNHAVGGNIMSLLFGDNFARQTTLSTAYTFYSLFTGSSTLVNAGSLLMPATTLASRCYFEMFKGCTSLTAAPALPATTLADYCYNGMFNGCTSLTAAPTLPATTLADNCYCEMFNGCTSLTATPALPATTLARGCYGNIFNGCTSLTAAPALPATTLADYCYNGMFYNCTSLTSAPALPATTLSNNCYSAMFWYCTSLTSAPALPATTLADYCYYNMFYNCTSLTTAPTLPATTLASNCYKQMFNGCFNLNSVTVGATSWDDSYTANWLNNVAATGTFTKPSATTIPESVDGIPSGWTVINV